MGNHNSGRRPQPTELKLLRGNPGKRKPNTKEPKPPAGEISARVMSAGAKQVWDELAPVAIAMGTLTTADVQAFATLCELQATLDRVCQEKDREGFTPFLLTTITDSAGNEHPKVQPHPAITLERQTASALRPYYEKFGLEPRGRASLSVPTPEEPESKWAGII